jgi:hypothetical protein
MNREEQYSILDERSLLTAYQPEIDGTTMTYIGACLGHIAGALGFALRNLSGALRPESKIPKPTSLTTLERTEVVYDESRSSAVAHFGMAVIVKTTGEKK